MNNVQSYNGNKQHTTNMTPNSTSRFAKFSIEGKSKVNQFLRWMYYFYTFEHGEKIVNSNVYSNFILSWNINETVLLNNIGCVTPTKGIIVSYSFKGERIFEKSQKN